MALAASRRSNFAKLPGPAVRLDANGRLHGGRGRGAAGLAVAAHDGARQQAKHARPDFPGGQRELQLVAPVQRVAGFDVVFPLAQNEKLYLPSRERVVKAVEATLSF